MNTWHVTVSPRVELRLFGILDYISASPLYNTSAAEAVYEDFQATLDAIQMMGERIPIGEHPIMQKRGLRRINFRNHRYYLVFRIQGNIAEVVRIAHFLEDPNKVLR